MKLNEAIEGFKNGKKYCIAEWRSGEATTRSGVFQGRPYSRSFIEHNLEVAGKPLTIQESLPDGTRTEGYALPYRRGDQVLLEWTCEPAKEPGRWRMSFRVHALEQEVKKAA